MTDNTQEDTNEKIKEAMEGHSDVRERVKSFTLRAIAERNLSFAELGALTEEIFQASVNTIKTRDDLETDKAIRSVHEGVTDAIYTSVDAAKKSTEHAAQKGTKFAQEELKTITEQLKKLQEDLQQSISKVAAKSDDTFRKPLENVAQEIMNASSRLNPIINETLGCLKDKPATSASVAAETILKGMSGILMAAADAIAPADKTACSDDEKTSPSSEQSSDA